MFLQPRFHLHVKKVFVKWCKVRKTNVCRGIWRDSSLEIGERIILFSRITFSLNILNVCGTRSLGGLLSVVTDEGKGLYVFFPFISNLYS